MREKQGNMSGARFVGKRLKIYTDEGAFEGLCSCVDPVNLRITLIQGSREKSAQIGCKLWNAEVVLLLIEGWKVEMHGKNVDFVSN